MGVVLYFHGWFPPSRAVHWLLTWTGIPFELKTMGARGETSQPWFHQINPQHTIPAIVDGDFKLAESRAICTYLINKYAPGHALYPTCPQKRAVVDRFLYFDIGTLYKAIGEYFYPKLIHGKEYDTEKEQKLKEVLGFLETFIGDHDFITGKEPSVADLCIGSSLTMLEVTSYGFPGFPKAEAYYNRVKQLPHWDECHAKGIEGFKQFLASKTAA
ncbi:glutathione S-transferase 1 isoform X2 [Galendromus occidentalis]|uniref:Glutathione S-transferase 1 isoform X2 n=1 Tax=Galendromus occidentalis TaxID=34638 RepID=A0AAJ7SGG3_9ACAR|nr:glutathione S-transferase 1 isoform X2 [Galendromus occidentalis]